MDIISEGSASRVGKDGNQSLWSPTRINFGDIGRVSWQQSGRVRSVYFSDAPRHTNLLYMNKTILQIHISMY